MAGVHFLVVCLLGCAGIVFAADGDITLLGGTPYTGRVSIELNGTRRAVCDSGFGIEEGHVVCRQLGFSYGALRVVSSSVVGFQFSSGQVVTHNLQCNGSEPSLINCVGATWSVEPSCGTVGQDEVVVYCALPFYEGCYDSSDTGAGDVGTSDGTSWAATVGVCRALEPFYNYMYAAFSSSEGDKCYNSQSFNVRVDDSLCANTCSYDRNLLCGGVDNYRAIYSTNLGAPGFSITSDAGAITSPNYPDPYRENQMSEWTVTLSDSLPIRVSFAVFNLQSGDNLTITYNGANEIFTTNQTWISNPTTTFTIRFTSGGSAGSGFILNYEVYEHTTTQAATTTQAPTTTPSPATTPPATTTAPPTTSPTSEPPSAAPPSTPSPEPSTSDTPMSTTDVTTSEAPSPSPTTPPQGTTPPPATTGDGGATDDVIQTTQSATTPPQSTMMTRDAKCQVQNVSRGQLSPQQAEVVQGTEVSLTCDDGYEASVTTATCLSNGTFDVQLACSRIVPFFRRLEFTHYVILLVAVAILGMFVVGISCAILFCKNGAKAEPPERDMADGAEKGLNRKSTETMDSEAYLLPISMEDNAGNGGEFDSYGAGNGLASPAFATDAHGVENGIANNQAIEMNGNTNIPEDTPNMIADTAPDQPPEPPSLPAEDPTVPDVQTSGPEIPAPDYDPIPDEEIPPPPSVAPPPPPPADEATLAPPDEPSESMIPPPPAEEAPPQPTEEVPVTVPDEPSESTIPLPPAEEEPPPPPYEPSDSMIPLSPEQVSPPPPPPQQQQQHPDEVPVPMPDEPSDSVIPLSPEQVPPPPPPPPPQQQQQQQQPDEVPVPMPDEPSDSVIPPPPAGAPPPPPPPPPHDEDSPPPGALNGSANPVDENSAELPSSVLPVQDVLY